MPCILVKFTQRSLGALCVALMAHAWRLNSLLKPSRPNAGKVQEEMYNLVDTLVIHGVDQKWLSAFALIEGAEEMVTTQEIRAVSWGSLFCVSAVPFWLKFYFINATGNGECSYYSRSSYKTWVEPAWLAAGRWDWLSPVHEAWHGKVPGDVQGWALGAGRLWNLQGLVGHQQVEGWVHPH